VAILLISWTFRIAEPNRKLAVIVFMISIGVALASHGELKFNLIGFITQAAAVGVRTLFLFHLHQLIFSSLKHPVWS
jgi:hypothetical protein